MNNSNANYAIGAAVIWAADDAVDEANAVSGTVDEAVRGVVKDAVWWAVRRALYGVMNRAGCHDPEHPALEDFLCAVGGVRWTT